MAHATVHIKTKYIPDPMVPIVHAAHVVGEGKIESIKKFLKADGQAEDPTGSRLERMRMERALRALYPKGRAPV